MKEENEVDYFFDTTFNNENLIKSAKRKSVFRITGVSFLVSICVFILIILLKLQLTPYFMHQKIVAKELYYELHGANIFTGNWIENYQLVGSTAIAPKYKLLNGKLVNLGEISLDTSNIETTIGNAEFVQYSYAGNRVMNFFHPSIQYRKYANDLHELTKVDDGKLIEMALSFDQPYSYEQVVAMLPKDVTLQWNWVNTFSTEELEGLKEANLTNLEYPPTFKEQEVVGFPMIAKDGQQIKEPVNTFVSTLGAAVKKGGSFKKEFEDIHNALKNGQTSLTNENIKIIGVVVVGDTQQLNTLKNKNYIKSSSFGVIVDAF